MKNEERTTENRERSDLPPIEIYTPERRAEFILGSAIDTKEYAEALAEVRAMGLDPETIPHFKPPGV